MLFFWSPKHTVHNKLIQDTVFHASVYFSNQLDYLLCQNKPLRDFCNYGRFAEKELFTSHKLVQVFKDSKHEKDMNQRQRKIFQMSYAASLCSNETANISVTL